MMLVGVTRMMLVRDYMNDVDRRITMMMMVGCNKDDVGRGNNDDVGRG